VNEALFTAVLALAWFGAVNLLLSGVAAAAGSLIERGTIRLRASLAPSILLGLKLLPGVAALFFTLVVFLPAQWRFEPEGADESVGYTLGVLGVIGTVALVGAARRAARGARLTRNLERSWEGRASGPKRFLADSLPVYCLPDASPIISLAGVRHPRVFVARPVMDTFSPDELEVSLAHELAHHAARDNVKRVLVACSPDFLALCPSGRQLEQRWRAAVEFAADARAVGGSEERAVALASALLKVARLAPAAGALLPGSGFYDGTLLWARIDRLLAPAESPLSPRPIKLAWSVSICGMTVLAAAAASEAVWLGVHLATEGLVRFLP
jgi:beta-lactamase regulating signal transducer with metallopeptidase domain